jgi:hypothetical protein
MQTQTGASLIELLISFLLLSILLLGVDAVQITALQKAKANYYFSVATQQLNILTEHLVHEKPIDTTALLAAWNQQNQAVLPQGRGMLHNNKITIFWGDTNESICEHNKIGQQGCLQRSL